MGAWDLGSFDNDEALDWIYELETWEEIDLLQEAFDTVIAQKGKMPEASDCSIALAAAEVVAALQGNPCEDLPEEVEEWIADKSEPDAALVNLCREAIDIILAESELKELWRETEDYNAWVEGVLELRGRV